MTCFFDKAKDSNQDVGPQLIQAFLDLPPRDD
jgi:hypothetical protein